MENNEKRKATAKKYYETKVKGFPRSEAKKAADKRYVEKIKHTPTQKTIGFRFSLSEAAQMEFFFTDLKNHHITKADFLRLAIEAYMQGRFEIQHQPENVVLLAKNPPKNKKGGSK